MKKRIIQIIAFAAIAGLASVAWAAAELDQAEFPLIATQPTDQAVAVGGSTVLTVEAVNGDSYQWLRNGVVIDGETNSTLVLENVGTNDVGYYTCAVIRGSEAVPTRAAQVNVYTLDGGGTITVFGAPVFSSGSQGTCPGPYAGYVNYKKTISQGWGWAPTVGAPTQIASDNNRTDTKVEYGGKYGDSGCNQTSVTVDPVYSPKYRFTIYFTNNVPTNAYAITLTGFDP